MQLRTTHTLSINDEDRKLNNNGTNKPSSGSGCINIDDPKRLLTHQIKSEAKEVKVGCVNILSYFFGCGMNQNKISTDSYKIYIYLTQIRLIWLVVIAILIYTFHYLQHISPYFMIILILILTISISLFVYSFYYAKKVENSGNNNTFSEACKWINTVFGIKNYSSDEQNIDDLFDFDRRIWGFCYLLLIPLACINSIICRATNIYEIWSSTGPTVAYMIALSLVIGFTSYYRVSSLYVKDMNNYIFDNDGNYNNNLTPKISKLNKCIQNKLKMEWKETKLIKNRKLEIILTFIVCLAFHLIVYGHFKDYIFSSNLKLITIVCCVYIYIIDSMILSMAFFIVFGLIYHYRFPSYILELFSYQFDSDSINDIVSWWELRKYYTQCIIEIYARSGLQISIGATLVGFIGLSFLVLQSIIYGQDEVVLGFVRLGFTITVAALTIIATTMAVGVYSAQLPHIHTLNKEKLRLAYIIKDNDDGFSKRDNIIFEQILQDIKDNVYCLSVFGIGMTPAFLVLLKTTSITVIVAAIQFIQG